MRCQTWRPLVLATLMWACDSQPTDPGGPAVAEVDDYVASLGSWEAYSPPLTDGDSETGATSTVNQVVGNTTYVCSVTPRSVTKTPQEIVMYEPNASIMWVGNLVQGDSYKGGTGSFEELSIRQRAPLKISIDLLTGNNFAIVDNPSLTSVNSAIGQLIQQASDQGHRSGSSIDYSHVTMQSTLEAMAKVGLSGSFTYSGIPAELEAEVGWELNASLKGEFAHFTQKMFTISIELPQSPGDFFSDALTPELLQAQVDAGNIGPNNLPVYIASITYGRTLTFTLVSADTRARLSAAVEASFKGIPNVASASGFAENELETTLSAQRLRATAIGGEGQNVIDLIRTGRLSEYFTTNAALTSARPISYQLNYLGNNSIARVSETTAYDQRECAEVPANPGRFDFASLQSVASGVNAPFAVYDGDFNGDGRGDLALSHLAAGLNQTRVGFGNADGSFTFSTTVAHPVTLSEGWADGYTTHVGDFDGDGDDDVLWDRVKGGPRRIWVALSDGVGGFTFLPVQEYGAAWASEWETRVGNLDNDADDDLYFNYRQSGNFSVLASSDGDGTFTLSPRRDHSIGSGWSNYDLFVADVDGAGRDDFIWNLVPQNGANSVYVGRVVDSTTLSFPANQSFLSGWAGYDNLVGNFGGSTGGADLAWVKTGAAGHFYVHRSLGNTGGTFGAPASAQSVARDTTRFGSSGTVPTYAGDFNGDGLDDLLFNRLAATSNSVQVGLAHSSGTFQFTEVPQGHPASENWGQFQVIPSDVTGDGVDDVVWVERTPTMKIYVATGR